MASYQNRFGEGPELSVLQLLGLFDRPADEQAVSTLLKPPPIPGLTESLVELTSGEWRALLTRLRRAGLLAGEDPHRPGHLDAYPLVREYFCDRLGRQRAAAWQQANRRLYEHYRARALPLPDNLREMEPLFLGVSCVALAVAVAVWEKLPPPLPSELAVAWTAPPPVPVPVALAVAEPLPPLGLPPVPGPPAPPRAL
jgi:hypothetical protein